MLVAVRAVNRGLERPLLVADMPFGSYQSSDDDAMRAAVKFIQAGAEAGQTGSCCGKRLGAQGHQIRTP
jgi:ketopantoate hydroxymethyltransferase